MATLELVDHLADIQGLILYNYALPQLRHFILRIENAREARCFVGGLANGDPIIPQITSALEWKERRKREYCLNIGFTYEGLQALKLPDTALASFARSKAFVEGAVRRARVIGNAEEIAPDRWITALRTPEHVHLLLSLYAQGNDALELQTKTLRALFQRNSVTELWCQEGHALFNKDHKEIIHFGYRDGISQPVIKGAPEPGYPNARRPPVAPGAFLLGYPSQWKNFIYPVPRPPELGQNGSFAAFCILQQDVAAFESYLQETVSDLKERYPAIPMDKEKLAAKLCGRWRNGVPLALSPDSQEISLPEKEWNNFTYEQDKDGYQCPFGSHMRRTNPRGDKVAGADNHQHPIIRRGMPYGPLYNHDKPDDGEERGLLGMFLCASLEDQFEFLMAHWMNEGGFRGPVAVGTKDPMSGTQTLSKKPFLIPTKEGEMRLKPFSQFVTTRGAAYCFLPSLTALRYIALLP